MKYSNDLKGMALIHLTCNCGSSGITFHKLTEKDFPNGWVNDCCLEKTKLTDVDIALIVENNCQFEMLDDEQKKERLNTPFDEYLKASQEAEIEPNLASIIDWKETNLPDHKKDKKNKYKGKK